MVSFEHVMVGADTSVRRVSQKPIFPKLARRYLLANPREGANDGDHDEHVRDDAAGNHGRMLYRSVSDDFDDLVY